MRAARDAFDATGLALADRTRRVIRARLDAVPAALT